MPSKSFSWINLVSASLVTLSLLLWFVLPSFAEETETEEDLQCVVEITPPMMTYYSDITTFIGEHYQAEAPASDLLETAMLKFGEFETNMLALLEEHAVSQDGQAIEDESRDIKKCIEMVNLKILEVKQMIRNHHLGNAGRKTTYTLVTKLKEINEGLREMNQEFGEMYGLFTNLSNKLNSTTGN